MIKKDKESNDIFLQSIGTYSGGKHNGNFLEVSISLLGINASHFMGGSITWECISDPTSVDFGKYIFQLKVYLR